MFTLLEKLSDRCVKKHTRCWDDECPICYDCGADIVYLNCDHFFHGKCIIKWLSSDLSRKPECPICKTRIKKIILSDVSINYYRSLPKNDMKNEIDSILNTLRNFISGNPQRLAAIFFIRSLLNFSLIHTESRPKPTEFKYSKITESGQDQVKIKSKYGKIKPVYTRTNAVKNAMDYFNPLRTVN